jgi:hypothetical protein
LDEKLKLKFAIMGLKLGKSWLATLTSIQPKEETRKRKRKKKKGVRKGANVVQFNPNYLIEKIVWTQFGLRG